MWLVVQNHFKNFWKKYLALLLFEAIVIVIILSFKGYDKIIYYCDAFFVAAAIDIALGGLSVLSYFGALNGIGYIGRYTANKFSFVFGMFGTSKKEEKVDSYRKYIEEKENRRSRRTYNFIPYFTHGIPLLIVAIILFCILK